MRKKFLTVAATAVMTMSMLMSAFADTETDLIAHYAFDGDATNAVTGEEATQTGKAFADAAGDTFTYEDGVNGQALVMAVGNTDGYNLNVAADGDAFTVSLWAKSDAINGFAEPIVWYGSQTQSPENWIGIWPGLSETWSVGGPILGSNDASGNRYGVLPGTNNITSNEEMTAFDWHMITIVVEDGVGKLYYDGTLVSMSSDGEELPSITGDDKSFYLGVNAWDVPFAGSVDELYIYERALTSDDVAELYTATNVAGVAAAELDGYTEPVKLTPTLAADDGSFTTSSSSTADDDDKDDMTMTIIIIAVVVVVVVVVIVAVVSSSKKKNAKEEE